MCFVSLAKNPLYGFYYLLPFVPYRTLRDHFLDYPLGANVFTILTAAVILGALMRGKRLPKSRLYVTWLIYGVFLYLSMWMGAGMGNAPPPLWLSDVNFLTWKDYMLVPLLFVAGGLVIEDRKAVKTTIVLVAVALLSIDRSSLMESLSRSWTTFDENKRDSGPLGYGANQTAAFLAQFMMFFWGLVQFIKRKSAKLILYGLIGASLIATMYTFSRGAYLAVVVGVLMLALFKDRKLLLILGVFMLTWQTVVPTPVQERIMMTKSANGHLEASAQERVDLWTDAKDSFMRSPLIGSGYATFQYGEHVAGLGDTHNWYVKVLTETGIVGFIIVVAMLIQAFGVGFGLFRHGVDPLYRGLGLGLFLALWASVVANCFGDRWTYIEITGLLWVLVSAAIRAREFSTAEVLVEEKEKGPVAANPYLAYR
jgi:putative inorganic carbon (HCO3(-)) transporter